MPKEPKSKCCGAEIIATHGEDFGGTDDMHTWWNECQKCKQPCDAESPDMGKGHVQEKGQEKSLTMREVMMRHEEEANQKGVCPIDGCIVNHKVIKKCHCGGTIETHQGNNGFPDSWYCLECGKDFYPNPFALKFVLQQEKAERPNKCCDNGDFGDDHKCQKEKCQPESEGMETNKCTCQKNPDGFCRLVCQQKLKDPDGNCKANPNCENNSSEGPVHPNLSEELWRKEFDECVKKNYWAGYSNLTHQMFAFISKLLKSQAKQIRAEERKRAAQIVGRAHCPSCDTWDYEEDSILIKEAQQKILNQNSQNDEY